MSYGLAAEMRKQAEVVQGLRGVCAQVLPRLSQEHSCSPPAASAAGSGPAPTPLPLGLQPPSLPAVSAGTGLLSLSALGSQARLSKEDKSGHDGDTHQEGDGEKSD
ncbi:hypothetical protein FD754_023529 [Muntiacus muntjak]|uniref:Groucho/TLE N-terminal Q-rich domain-containing protein n=1 Tax=Muntiacus muntjak TaxID=9888 RepID=A0A5N3UT39_MUNMU|nr:hypothetical protein FD754_023532 [Muntiacus muntjak]KAB0339942.1 hypothetical protein FD754_023529 [Muntiacus muntjak]